MTSIREEKAISVVRKIRQIGLIYCALTFVYNVALRVISDRLEFSIVTKIGVHSPLAVICLIIFTLSLIFKLSLLLVCTRFSSLLVLASVFFTGINHTTLGLNVTFFVLALALVAAIIKCIVDTVKGRFDCRPLIGLIFLFAFVGAIWILTFIVGMYTAYEKTELYESPDSSYVIEYTASYGFDNEPTEGSGSTYVMVFENCMLDAGITRLLPHGKSAYRITLDKYDADDGELLIKWLDRDTFSVNGKEYEVAEILKD